MEPETNPNLNNVVQYFHLLRTDLLGNNIINTKKIQRQWMGDAIKGTYT